MKDKFTSTIQEVLQIPLQNLKSQIRPETLQELSGQYPFNYNFSYGRNEGSNLIAFLGPKSVITPLEFHLEEHAKSLKAKLEADGSVLLCFNTNFSPKAHQFFQKIEAASHLR